jgi:cytochrome c biogenesis protein CcdA
MFLDYFQYVIKFTIIIFGIVIFFNVFELDLPDTTRQVIGLIVIMFGAYRLVIYQSKKRKYEFEQRSQNEE